MDIQQWLAATDDKAGPGQPDHDRIPDAFRAHPQSPGRGPPLGHSYRRRKRKRASSDSSIIAPQPTLRSRAQAVRSFPADRARSVETADRSSQVSSPSAPPASGDVPEKTYERRPRHKTRADRYEPKQKKRKTDRPTRKERDSGKKRRQSRRSCDGGRTAGLVQSFQLKNGPKNHRLTIKPGATAGLFKHGRASTQVKGRGVGCRSLPDLVFNEMRFLQRPTEHQGAPAAQPEQQEQRNKNHRQRPNDGEISAYFTTKNAAHAEPVQGQQTPPRREHAEIYGRIDRGRGRQRHSTPPVELPSRPFLGFGSKGGPPDVGRTRSAQTSYLSWSQTSPEPQDGRKIHITGPNVDAGELSTRRAREVSQNSHRQRPSRVGNDNDDEDRRVQQLPASRRGQWIQTRGGKGAAHLKVYQPPSGKIHRSIEERRSATTTTSQSLPRGLGEHSRKVQQPAADQTAERYHTSDILKVYNSDFETGKHDIVENDQFRAEKENQDPASSFSIDRLLDDVRHLATTTAAKGGVRCATVDGDDPLQNRSNMRRVSASAGRESARPVRGEATPHAQPPPALRGIDAHDQTASLQDAESFVQEPERQETSLGGYAANFLSRERQAPHDSEMLDNGQDLDAHLMLREPICASRQQAEELVHDLEEEDFTPGSYEAQSEQLASESASLWQRQRTPSNTLLARSLSVGRTLEGERGLGTVEGGGMADGLSGFWKPNKLY